MRTAPAAFAILLAAIGPANSQQDRTSSAELERPTSSDTSTSPSAATEATSGQGTAGSQGDASATATTNQAADPSARDYQNILELPALRAPYEVNEPAPRSERGGDAAPLDVIGVDDRRRIENTTTYPERAVVLITMDGGRCSGFLYGRDVVATAGHCVHSGGVNGQWSRNIRVFPGRNGASAPYGSCGARRLHSVEGWTRNGDRNFDYGVIKLDCTIGDRVGWFGYYWTSGNLNGTPSQINGYPGDKPLTHWTSSDSVRTSTALKVFYMNDTAGGMSGSPVFHQHPQWGRAAFAIHTNGRHNGPPWDTHNAGTRLTRERYENLQRWRDAN